MLTLRGSLDIVTRSGAMGWAFSPGAQGKVTVQALLNRAVIGEATANMHRPDLAAVGMGDGKCGYHISFFQEIDPLYLPFVSVRLEDSDVELPRMEISGFSDYFTALYRTHPVSGRPRSVFGGLWTDRIDAASLLRVRVEIGAVTPEVGASLSGLIRSGLTIVQAGASAGGTTPPVPSSKRSGNAAAVSSRREAGNPNDIMAAVLQSQPLLRLLQAILEGQPLVLSSSVVEGAGEGFRQPSAMETLPSPNECVGLVVPLDDATAELEIVRDSHLFPEFSADGQSRWVNPSSHVAIDVALQQRGMIDQYTVSPGSVVIIGPGLIHRVRTEPGAAALRLHCTPSRIAPLDRILDGSRKEIILESGARIWT